MEPLNYSHSLPGRATMLLRAIKLAERALRRAPCFFFLSYYFLRARFSPPPRPATSPCLRVSFFSCASSFCSPFVPRSLHLHCHTIAITVTLRPVRRFQSPRFLLDDPRCSLPPRGASRRDRAVRGRCFRSGRVNYRRETELLGGHGLIGKAKEASGWSSIVLTRPTSIALIILKMHRFHD